MARVLIIDDDESVRKSLFRVLAIDHHDVLEARDGREAWELLEDATPDLIITDLYMPEMDGIEFMIRLVGRASGVPVIAMSGGGYARAEAVLSQALSLGAVDALAKPFETGEVLATVRRFLGDPSPASSPGRHAGIHTEGATSASVAGDPAILLDGSGRTVLVLDDDSSVRRSIERVLSGLGFEVIGAADAHEAIQLLSLHPGPIHIVVCDLVLPGLSGREAANVILAKRPEARVLYMSGFTTTDSFRREIQESGRPFLSKPFEIRDLIAGVGRLLDG